MKILSFFKMSKEEREDKKVERLARSLKRGQEKLLDDLEAKKDALDAKISKLTTLKPDEVKEDSWNKEYHQAIVDLKMLEAEIKIAQDVQSELFSDEKSEG